MSKLWLKRAVIFSVLIAASGALWLGVQNSKLPTHIATNKPAQVVVEPPVKQDPAPAFPFWGGALNSTSPDGKAFFDFKAARAFMESIDPKLRPYVIELRSRSFLPAAFNAGVSLEDIFPKADARKNSPVLPQAYIQFTNHPDDAQRSQLAAAGIELLAYESGYAWSARGSENAFASVANLNYVRGLARVDPHDKMHPEVLRAARPDYALAPDGRTRYVVLTHPGTTLDSFKAELSANSELVALDVQAFQPNATSHVGPRFEIVAKSAQVLAIASAYSTAYVELAPHPVAVRDAQTDKASLITQVRDQNEMLDGSGITAGMRELTKPVAHVDFASRLTFVDSTDIPGSAAHATEVAGVIASNGATVPTAKGVAPNVKLFFYSISDGAFATTDIGDMASKSIRFSNHSYGPVFSGNPDPTFGIPPFGDYRTVSADWDNAMRANNHLCILAGYEAQSADYVHEDYFVGSKNGICVGAASKTAMAASPGTPGVDGIASFSNYGPMVDGRIKPDLVAFGDGVTMTFGTNSSANNQGTSFSTPAVTGIAALVSQRYSAITGNQASAALLKAILCESATDLGLPGPDAIYGFGIANARAAVDLVNLRTGGASPFAESAVKNAENQQYVLTVNPGLSFLKATLVWMDPAGTPGTAKALVNDLDLLITDPTGKAYFPYSLNPANPSAAATANGPNTVDPIEQIFIANPVAGDWTVTVAGTSVPSGPQPFAFCSNVVFRRPLVANAIASPTKGPAPLDVLFNASGSSGDIQNYYWQFGDGATDTGVSVSHTYSKVGAYTATLTITDSVLDTRTVSIDISVEKNLKIVYPYSAGGKFSSSKDSANQLSFAVIVNDLVRTPQQARDAIKNGEFEGKHYYVRAGPATGALVELNTFLVDRKIQQKGKTEFFQLDLSKGKISSAFKQNTVSPVHDLKALFGQFGINAQTASPYEFMMRVEIESDIATEDVIYRADFPMVYSGKAGSGSLKLKK